MQYRTLVAATLAATTTYATLTNDLSQSETLERDTILITATRTPRSVQSIPGNPTVITSEDIAKEGFTSAPEALQKKAGLHIRNYSDNPNRASVDIRGFGENSHGRVLVLVNGRRINRPDLGPVNWSQIPMGNVDRIEVVRGAHSALYGDYAVGGVINIITRRGQEEPQTEIAVTGGSHGFNDETFTTTGEYEDIGYTASVGHQSADGYRDRSAYETWSGSVSLENDPSEWLGTWLDYSYIDSEYELPGGLTAAQLQQNRRQSVNPDDDATETFNNVGIGMGLYPNENNEASLEFGFSRKDIESNIASWFSFNTWTIDTYSLSPKYIYMASPFERDNRLTLGADIGYDDVDVDLYADRSHSSKNGSANVEKRTVGAYVHDELTLTDNLILSGGARTEKARYSISDANGTAAQPDTHDTHRLEAYDAGITYLPVEQLKLFARVDKLYRLPFIDEQSSYQGFGPAFNADLDPETGWSYEVGMDYSPVDEFSLQCTLFRLDMEDEISFAVTNNATFEGANFNMEETRHQGVEIAVDWQAADWMGLYANYTFQEVEYTDGANNGNELPLVPANLISAGLDAALCESVHILANVTYTDEQYAGSAADNSAGTELDAYTVVDIALRYTLHVKKTKTELFAGIDNLFAEEYSPLAYGGSGSIYAYYPAPERTYKAGVKVWF